MGVKEFRKKPVVIEAIEWDGTNFSEVLEFTGEKNAQLIRSWCSDYNSTLLIPTLEADHRASIGDYIIKGIRGEFYPCKPDIFRDTYEEVL